MSSAASFGSLTCWLGNAEAGTYHPSPFSSAASAGEHFAQAKGYDAYAQKAEIARKGGMDCAIDGFMKAAVWGPPDRILRELEARRSVTGDFELNTAFRFDGIPYETAETLLRLFAKKVLPVLKTWASVPIASVTD